MAKNLFTAGAGCLGSHIVDVIVVQSSHAVHADVAALLHSLARVDETYRHLRTLERAS